MSEMSEITLSLVAIPWILGTLALFSWLYQYGGMEGTSKVWRRYVAGIFFTFSLIVLAVFLHRFSPWMLASLAAYPAGLSLGYGGTHFSQKFYRRLRYGLALGVAGLFFAIPTGHWFMGLLQIVFASWASVYFGLVNPIQARGEETLISLALVLFVPFMLL